MQTQKHFRVTQKMSQPTINKLSINQMFDNQGKKQSLDKLLTAPVKNIWNTALSNELLRLTQWINNVNGNDVIDFIYYKDVPKDKIDTYTNMVCNIRPFKTEKHRIRLIVRGDRLQCPDNTA